MAGISGDNIIKFVLGISGLGLSLASFTLSRVFTLEDYAHVLSEKIHGNEVRIEYSQNLTEKIDQAQRTLPERLAALETKLLIIEEALRELKEAKRAKGE